MSAVTNDQRYSSREDRPCPICGGGADDPRGEGVRCIGFVSGSWARCSRTDTGRPTGDDGTYVHRLLYGCPCGKTHSEPTWWKSRVTKFPYVENDIVIATHMRRDWPTGPKDMWWVDLNGRAPATLPLYGADALGPVPKRIPIVLVEGEKKRDMLMALNIPAVATGTGAPGTHEADVFKALLDFNVILWADDNEAGRQQRRANVDRLQEIGHPNVTEMPDGTPAPDDYIAANRGAEAVLALLDQAVPISAIRTAGSGVKPLALTRGDAITMRAVPYAWQNRIPRGSVTLIVGDPGEMKTAFCLDYVARASRAMGWPDGAPGVPVPEATLYLSAEDDPSFTLKPRFIAAGGDPTMIFFENVESDDGLVSLEKDCQRVEAALVACGAKHLVIDVLNAYLPGVDSWKDSSIRSALKPLARVAAKLGVTVLAIMHFNKKSEYAALQKVMGSVGYTGMARAAYSISKDQADPERRLMLVLKFNLGPDPAGLAFRREPIPVRLDDGVVLPMFRLKWETEPVTITANEALRKPSKTRPVDDAATMIGRLITDQPVKAEEMFQALDGIPPKTIERAKAKAGVGSIRYADGPWWWTPSTWKQSDREPWLQSQAPAKTAKKRGRSSERAK